MGKGLIWLGRVLLLVVVTLQHADSTPADHQFVASAEYDCPSTFFEWADVNEFPLETRRPKSPEFCQNNSTVYHTAAYKSNQNNCASCTCKDGPFVYDVSLQSGETYDKELAAEWLWPDTTASCCPGWNGTRCNVCTNANACPAKYNSDTGNFSDALNCSYGSLIPNQEEAAAGKRFSCTCGGGGDLTTQYGCDHQPLTSWDWTMYGLGSEDDPMRIEVTEFAGLKRVAEHIYPDSTDWHKYDYYYPDVFNGNITGCKASIGPCMNVPGTDARTKQCLNWECEDTEIFCPPRGYPTCPGWDGLQYCDCYNDSNPEHYGPTCENSYKIHLCVTIPENNNGFLMSCMLDRESDGTHICYFNQPGSISPLSMTCSVGNCLYEPEEKIELDYTDAVDIATIYEQIVGIVAVCAAIVGCCGVFLYISGIFEWATRKSIMDSDSKGTAGIHVTTIPEVQPELNFDDNDLGQPVKSLPETVEEGASTEPLLADDGLSKQSGVASRTSKIAPILTWEDLSLWVPDTKQGGAQMKQILHSLSGLAGEPKDWQSGGGITALMGQSGAGKTSLLNLLAGRPIPWSNYTGEIRINGHMASIQEQRDHSGYVTQHDVLPGMLTVRELLLFHARLRLGDHVALHAKQRRVTQVIDDLGLARVTDSIIGDEFLRGISGGEKRRVSIACELLSLPSLLFLDEATTGLDSSNAIKVVRLLSEVASQGTTVVMSIHQPRNDIFRLFTRVVLLAKGGRTVYCGQTQGVVEQLHISVPEATIPQSNPADVILDLSCGPEKEALVEAYAASVQFRELQQDIHTLAQAADDRIIRFGSAGNALHSTPKKFRAMFHTQLLVLSLRLVKKAIRHPMLLALHYLGSIFMALTLGSIFQNLGYDLDAVQDKFGVLFFALLYFALLGMSSLPVWRDEYTLFTHELSGGLYTLTSYYFAVVFFDIFLVRVVPPFVFTLIAYPMIDLRNYCSACLYQFTLILVLANVAFALWAMAIGAVRLSTTAANVVGAVVVLVFVLMGGYLVDKDQITSWVFLKLLLDINPMEYAFEALMINQFHGAVDQYGDPVYYLINATYCAKTFPAISVDGDTILSTFHYPSSNDQLEADEMALVKLLVALLVAIYLILVWTSMGQQHCRRVFCKMLACCKSSSACRMPDCGASNDAEHFDGQRRASEAEAPEGEAAAGTGAVLTWNDINLWVGYPCRPKKQILHSISGMAGPSRETSGDVCALMGSSGAGKTSLLDVLAGRKYQGRITGTIYVNGRAMTGRQMREVSGYVVQEDILPSMLTVIEHLKFHAHLRLGSRVSAQAKTDRAYEIAKQLGLASVLDSPIGSTLRRGISGGEKRRVSIAVEFLTRPALL